MVELEARVEIEMELEVLVDCKARTGEGRFEADTSRSEGKLRVGIKAGPLTEFFRPRVVEVGDSEVGGGANIDGSESVVEPM